MKTFEIIAFKMKRKCKDCHKKAVVSVGKLCSGCKSLHWLFSCLILCNKIIYMTTMVYIYSIGDQKQNFVCCNQSCEAEILPISLILGENLLFFLLYTTAAVVSVSIDCSAVPFPLPRCGDWQLFSLCLIFFFLDTHLKTNNFVNTT